MPPPNPLDEHELRPTAPSTQCYWSWARLMRRAFEIDVLACPRCGGRLRLIATVDDPREIHEVLDTLAHAGAPMERAPPSHGLEDSPVASVVT